MNNEHTTQYIKPSDYFVDESLDIPINVKDVDYGNVSLKVKPTYTATVSIGDDDFEIVTRLPTKEQELKTIMELITDKPRPPPKKPPTLMDQLPSMRAIAMTTKDIANKLPYAKEVTGYVKDVVDDYLPPAKDMWQKVKKKIKAPMKIYKNYVNSFTYYEQPDYG